MRYIDQDNNEIEASAADCSKGYLYTEQIIKPDATPIDNVTKFAWADEDFETVMRYVRLPDAEIAQSKIAELKKQLQNTDYAILKIVEGAATLAEYAETIRKRAAWRKEINDLEKVVEEV